MEQETRTRLVQFATNTLSNVDPDYVTSYLYGRDNIIHDAVVGWLETTLTDDDIQVFNDNFLKDFDAIAKFVVKQATPHIVLKNNDLSRFAYSVVDYLADEYAEVIDDLLDEEAPFEGSSLEYGAVQKALSELDVADFEVDPGTNIESVLDLARDKYLLEPEAIAVLAGYASKPFTGANFGDWLSDSVQTNPETTLAVKSLMYWTGVRDTDALESFRDRINELVA